MFRFVVFCLFLRAKNKKFTVYIYVVAKDHLKYTSDISALTSSIQDIAQMHELCSIGKDPDG